MLVITHVAEAFNSPDKYAENANRHLQQNLGTTIEEPLPSFQRMLLNMMGLGSSKMSINFEVRTTPKMDASCRAVTDACGEEYLTGESNDEAYQRTLIGDQIRGEFDKV